MPCRARPGEGRVNDPISGQGKGSYAGARLAVLVYTESIKHQKITVLNIIWPKAHSAFPPTFSLGGMPPAPSPFPPLLQGVGAWAACVRLQLAEGMNVQY